MLKQLKSDLLPLVILFIIPLIIIDGALLHNQALLPLDILPAYPALQTTTETKRFPMAY